MATDLQTDTVGMSSKRKTPGHIALRRGRSSMPGQIYHVTIATKARFRAFDDDTAAGEAARCFETRAFLGDASMLAWVLMPDHAHWLLQLGDEDLLTGIVAKLKSASARRVNRVLGRNGALWASAFHDHALRNEEDMRTVARYIVANPIRAGLVARIGDYPYWNAIWL